MSISSVREKEIKSKREREGDGEIEKRVFVSELQFGFFEIFA